jgi:hypothetical protein
MLILQTQEALRYEGTLQQSEPGVNVEKNLSSIPNPSSPSGSFNASFSGSQRSASKDVGLHSMGELSPMQREHIPLEKQAQFYKLARTTQVMIKNVKYIFAKILLHLQNAQMDSEILTAANIVAKLKKVPSFFRIIHSFIFSNIKSGD